MSGPRGSRLPSSYSTRSRGRLIPPRVQRLQRQSSPRPAWPAGCWLGEAGRWPLWAARWQAPPGLGAFQSRTLSDLYMRPHIRERRQDSWCIQDNRMMGTRSSQQQRQDSEGSAGWWFFFFLVRWVLWFQQMRKWLPFLLRTRLHDFSCGWILPWSGILPW